MEANVPRPEPTLNYDPAHLMGFKPSPNAASPIKVHGRVGSRLQGRYEILEFIGEGGTAHVFRGLHTTLRRTVAIKILRPEYARSPQFVSRFLREARIAATIEHDHVIRILDFGMTDDRTPYCVMECVQGEDLAQRLGRRGRLPWSETRRIMLQLCGALASAHQHGIVHRDVKPQNCLLVEGDDGQTHLKIIDFGIAKPMAADATQTDEEQRPEGMIMGTLAYMAPEQAKCIGTDHRSDIYSAGALMYELLTGRVPFEGVTGMEVLAQHICLDPLPPSLATNRGVVPKKVDEIVLRALNKRPEDRYCSIQEMAEAIERIPPHASSGWLSGRSSVLVAVLSMVGLLVVGFYVSIWSPIRAAAAARTTTDRAVVSGTATGGGPEAIPPGLDTDTGGVVLDVPQLKNLDVGTPLPEISMSLMEGSDLPAASGI
jgi:serine/threonine protein kinase